MLKKQSQPEPSPDGNGILFCWGEAAERSGAERAANKKDTVNSGYQRGKKQKRCAPKILTQSFCSQKSDKPNK